VDWSRWPRGSRLGVCVATLALLAAAGCAPERGPDHGGRQPQRSPGAAGPGGPGAGCNFAPAAVGGPLPVNLVDVSAVRGRRQAWAVAGRPDDPFGAGNYLLHVSGRTWTTAATFGRDIHLTGVSAVSGNAAWVWGSEGHDSAWNSFRPFLALVSGGVITRPLTGLPRGVGASVMASDGAADTWLVGGVRGRHGQPLAVVARWDGRSWHEVPAPPGAGAAFSLSLSEPSDVWASVSSGFNIDPWLAHWNGTAWSMAYAPPAGLAVGGRVPQAMRAASSPGRAWVTYTEAGTNSGSNERNPIPETFSAYFDGSAWRMVPVPATAEGVAGVTMSGGDAWAISAYHNINGVLYSHLGSAWCVQHLPHGSRLACAPTSISAASPTYVIAVTGRSSGRCRRSYAFVYDGRRWRAVNRRPAS
jgi:hypothetical protein